MSRSLQKQHLVYCLLNWISGVQVTTLSLGSWQNLVVNLSLTCLL